MREYFLAYHSMLEAMRKLSDAEVGRLFRGLLHYSMTEEQPDNFQGREELLFDVFSQQIDRERAKYQRKCETNRENVTKRYATTGNKRIRSNTNVYEIYQYKEEDKEKDENKDEEVSKKRARTRFTPPTVDEVRAYAAEKGYSKDEFDPERFVDFYASKGWKVGKEPMKDWQAAARGWVSRYRQEHQNGGKVDKVNPALNYAQRIYTDEDFGSDFYVNLEEYGE